jgi:hypothetical protein
MAPASRIAKEAHLRLKVTRVVVSIIGNLSFPLHCTFGVLYERAKFRLHYTPYLLLTVERHKQGSREVLSWGHL